MRSHIQHMRYAKYILILVTSIVLIHRHSYSPETCASAPIIRSHGVRELSRNTVPTPIMRAGRTMLARGKELLAHAFRASRTHGKHRQCASDGSEQANISVRVKLVVARHITQVFGYAPS